MGSISENRQLVVGTEIDSPLENFLFSAVRRARVRDDPGRSPQIELEPEREVFDGHFPASPSMSRPNRVLRHTESVRGDKVQEQDWRQGAGAKVAPPARPRDDITAQSHSVPGGQRCQ